MWICLCYVFQLATPQAHTLNASRFSTFVCAFAFTVVWFQFYATNFMRAIFSMYFKWVFYRLKLKLKLKYLLWSFHKWQLRHFIRIDGCEKPTCHFFSILNLNAWLKIRKSILLFVLNFVLEFFFFFCFLFKLVTIRSERVFKKKLALVRWFLFRFVACIRNCFRYTIENRIWANIESKWIV